MDMAPCPNCGSGDLRSTTTSAAGHAGPDLLPGASGLFRVAQFTVVVCCQCGLTRFFVAPQAMDKIAKSALWERV